MYVLRWDSIETNVKSLTSEQNKVEINCAEMHVTIQLMSSLLHVSSNVCQNQKIYNTMPPYLRSQI